MFLPIWHNIRKKKSPSSDFICLLKGKENHLLQNSFVMGKSFLIQLNLLPTTGNSKKNHPDIRWQHFQNFSCVASRCPQKVFPCVWEEDVIALLRRDCTRQQPQTRRKLNPPSLSFALPAVNLLPGSRAPAQVLSFINELWKPSGSICLKSWQTAGRFGSCQILWALGAGPLPPSQ